MGEEEKADVSFNAFPLTSIDRQILAMKDEDFHLTQWDELREIICMHWHNYPRM